MTDYTDAERKTINRAYDAINYISQCLSWGSRADLKAALAFERKHRSNATTAKALIVQLFEKGRVENPDAAYLFGISDGLRTAAILGAAVADRYPEMVPEDWQAICDACAGAHSAALERMLDSLDGGPGND